MTDNNRTATPGRRTQRHGRSGQYETPLPPVLEEPGEPTPDNPRPMHDFLAQLQARREANGGWLVTPPPEHVLRAAAVAETQDPHSHSVWRPNRAMLQVKEWFETLYAAGAGGREIEIARARWKPDQSGRAVHWLREACIDRLQSLAYARTNRRLAQRAAENQPQSMLGELNMVLRRAQEARQKAEEEFKSLQANEQRAMANVEHHLMQHPHLRPRKLEAA